MSIVTPYLAQHLYKPAPGSKIQTTCANLDSSMERLATVLACDKVSGGWVGMVLLAPGNQATVCIFQSSCQGLHLLSGAEAGLSPRLQNQSEL